MKLRFSQHRSDIGQAAGNRRRRRHRWTYQMGTAAPSLSSLEVAVRGRGTALARTEEIVIHAETHGAAGISPLEACIDEDTVQPLSFGGLLDLLRSGNNQGTHSIGHATTVHDLCSLTQIFESGV